MIRLYLICSLLVVMLVLQVGCTSAGAGPTSSSVPKETATAPLLSGQDAFDATVIYTGRGERSTWAEVIERALVSEVVIIAEQHGRPVGLSAAAAMWRELLKSAGPDQGQSPALALEFFERDQQAPIDAFLRGQIKEEKMLGETGKRAALSSADPWSTGYPPGHRDMVLASVDSPKPVPVVAANAPRRLVRLARTDGYDAVRTWTGARPLADLPRFADNPPDSNPPDSRYWRDFLRFLGSSVEEHAAAPESERARNEGMFRAQSVWDATMAASVRQLVNAGHRPVVLVVGQFHTDFATPDNRGGGGLLQELRAWRPATSVLTVSFQSTSAWRTEDAGRADFVVFERLTR